jgi:hypothetical protein
MTGDREPQAMETLLRDALTQQTRDVSADSAFVNATLDHSVMSLRKTRRNQLALTAGAVAAAIGLVAWQAPSLVDNGSPGPTRHSDSSQVDDGYNWAESLPRGADADVAYIDRGTLVIGSKKVDLGKQEAEFHLLDALPGGWLADQWAPTGQPNEYSVTNGYLSRDGGFTPYPSVDGRIGVTGTAVSPDGTEVAYEGTVVRTGITATGAFESTVAGTQAQTLPADVKEIYDWTDAGLIYSDGQNRFWLWSPGTQPTQQRFDDVLPGGYGYRRDGDCVAVARIQTPTTLAPSFYNLCGRGDPLTVSTGRRALMSDGEFVNLEAGVDFLTLPDSVDPSRLQLHWESDDNLILVIPDDAVGQPHSVVLVRCTVSSGLCERASDPLSSIPQLAPLPRPEKSAH